MPAPTAPAATPSAVATVAPTAGTLRWALGADPTSLDPRRIVRAEDALVVGALFDSLTTLGADLTARPALALSWESSADATRWDFALDPDARWHDGSVVTAQDVVRGLQRVADGTLTPPSLHGALLARVEGYNAALTGRPLRGVIATGDHTLRIELTEPVPELPAILAHPSLAPVPEAAVVDAALFGEAPIGNGPFALGDGWAHNQFLRLVPSDTHPDPAAVDDIVLRVYADDLDRSVRFADLLAGQLQVAPLPLGRRAEAVELFGVPEGPGSPGVYDQLSSTVSLLVLDTERAPFDDERFRRGISLLLDREALASRTDGARSPATGLVPPTFPGGQARPCRFCEHDPETAATLIQAVLDEREADAGPVPPIVIQTSTDALHGALADQLSVALRAFGLTVRIVRPDAPDYLETAEVEGASVIRLGWTPTEPSLRGWTDRLLAGGEPAALLSGWQPPALRALLARASASVDVAVRAAAWQEVERLALDSAVIVPVLFYRQELVVGPGVEGLVIDPMGNIDLAGVGLVGADQP